ncbi:hypothetical protein RN001_013739 [Aquatica leii]|uniref:CHK kinase-like domain-containing protein n=1 Tax=Aquatica leii TaxID=1421715 RepID=A0AAN7SE34_9COLE|nr:hypothetical protein RN001_013739 [Aquatica leii]
MGFANNEYGIYAEIIPMMEKLKYYQKIAPKIYHLSTGLKKEIVMEDLSVLNYEMADRHKGLDLEHCLFVIKKLANFHASSVALYENDPKIMDLYDRGMFYRSNLSEQMFSVLIQDAINVWKNEPSLKKYYEKTTIDEVIKRTYKVRNRDSKLNVLNHGDFWVNNLLFHYDADERLDDVLFIDFQASVFASPFVDLHYFIVTSTSQEVKEKHIYDILRYYYDTLVENVKIFQVQTAMPNWNDFKKDFCDKAFIGITTSCIILPLVKAKNTKDASVENFVGNNEEGSFRRHCFTNTLYLNDIKFLLQFYDSLGVFNN